MRKKKLILVDDHLILLEGLKSLLLLMNDQLWIELESSGISFLNRSDLSDIDLVIMDINMKEKDGIQTFKESKAKGFSGKCVFLSSYNDLKLINEAIQLGASGYVTKNSATDCIFEAVEATLSNSIYYSPDIKDRILKAFSRSDDLKTEADGEKAVLRQLTERELDVLKLIGQELTSEEIAKKLYIAKSTVDTHRKNLINKLKVKNAVGLGLFAERNKLI